MSGSRKDVLSQALVAALGDPSVDYGDLFTNDAVGWSPIATVSGLGEIADLFAARDVAFSNVTIELRGLDGVGNRAYAEWLIQADHTGSLELGEDVVLEANGRHVVVPGITVADFRDGKIRSFRTYFDDVLLFEQLVDA
jgi:ketosteroid isomerase-like protein